MATCNYDSRRGSHPGANLGERRLTCWSWMHQMPCGKPSQKPIAPGIVPSATENPQCRPHAHSNATPRKEAPRYSRTALTVGVGAEGVQFGNDTDNYCMAAVGPQFLHKHE